MIATAHIYCAGIVSAAGVHNSDNVSCIDTAETAIREIVGFEVPDDSPGLAGELRNFDISRDFPSIKSYIDRCSALALRAGLSALSHEAIASGLTENVGLVFASEFACLETMKMYCAAGVEKGWKFAPPFLFIHSYANTPAALMHIELRLKGYSNVFSGYSGAGFSAIADAVMAVSSGDTDNVLAGAAESLGPVRYKYLFDKGELGSLDEPRENNSPGEGAAFLFIASSESKIAREIAPANQVSGIISYMTESGYHSIPQMPDYVFVESSTSSLPPEFARSNMQIVDLGPTIGRCGAAFMPMAAASFLLCSRFEPGSRAVFFSSSQHTRGFITVEKR